MPKSRLAPLVAVTAAVTVAAATLAVPVTVTADQTPGTLPFAQDWGSPDLVVAADDWSGVPSTTGYLGDGLASTGADPRSVLGEGTLTVDLVISAAPTAAAGGVHWLASLGTMALQGSGTADAPHLVTRLDTTGHEGITVAYDLVHLDADDATQPVALQYRVGGTGAYTNVPAGFVADAAVGTGTVTQVSAVLPPAVDDQPVVDVRIITADAPGSDAMIGVDNISITSGALQPEPTVTDIGAVQGTGASSPMGGQTVTIAGTVTSLFTRQDVLDGYFVQDAGDGDDSTSDGIFVFCSSSCPPALATGDAVTVTGPVSEYFGMTQVSATTADATTIVSSGNALPPATVVDLPAGGSTRDAATFEAVEGMLVTIPQTLTVSEYFQLARFGEVVLTVGQRPEQFTDANTPDVDGYNAHLADLATRRIILDDDNNDQNDAVSHGPDEAYPWPQGGLAVDHRVRGGDTITGLTAVLHWSFAGQSGTDAWRLRPVDGVDVTFTAANPAPAPVDVGGDLRVASFNVLNYFASIDDGTDTCGPTGGQECRGADSIAELDAQRAKIVDALVQIDAAVVGLIEIQNDDGASADDLVAGLDAATSPGSYAAIDTGTIGTDAIKQALLYQPALVTPVGDPAILDSSVDPTFLDTENRPVLVQTFEEVASGERFTVAVNHFKSKGSSCDAIGDPDLGDGAGNCNATRTAAAAALAEFLAGDPTGAGDPDVLIIGDLNSYRMEQPITTLTAAGYTDLLAAFGGDDAYTYVFDGQLGYLDHALANESLVPQVTGAAAWPINADEIPLFDYNDAVHDTAGEPAFERESTATDLADTSALRSSDHDPVVVGLALGDAEDQPLRLTLLHNNDGESALLPNDDNGIGGAARFATIVDELRATAAAEPGNADSLLVSSGDNFLAGLALQASLANYDGDTDYSDDGPFYDALLLDHLGYDASAVGNHEFDFGPNVLGYFISQFDTSNIRFVSANLDVTGDAALAQFVAASPGDPGTLVEWTRADAGGRSVAIVGATTPILPTISSPGPDVVVDPDVRAAVQGAIDEATADGTEIVILISHLQNILEDQALIAELEGLDIAVAGGGDELLANDDDLLLPGSIAPYGPYPIIQEAADGADVPIVTTQGSYGYVGRLIVDIDADGAVTAIDDRSGPVRNAFDPVTALPDQAEPDPWVLANVEQPVAEYIGGLADQVVAHTEVALDGRRASVRTQETNLGSFFADALREAAELADPAFGAANPTVALQNSGGIRNDSILGPDADITAQDVFNIAAFENFLSYVPDVSPEQLKVLMEHSVSAPLVNGALSQSGGFGQISGMRVVFDPTRQAQVVDASDPDNVVITTPGERVRQLTLTLNDDDPTNDIVVVLNGEVVAGAPDVDLASNSFTIGNGDSYPFNVPAGGFVNLGTTYREALQAKFVREGVVTAAEYPEGGLGRVVIGGDVPAEPELHIDGADLTFSPRRAGVAAVTGSVDDTLSRCPRLELAVDGTTIVSARTVNLLGLCVGLGWSGLVTYELRSSEFGVLAAVPRGFAITDPAVDFDLTLGDEAYAATVTGVLRSGHWSSRD